MLGLVFFNMDLNFAGIQNRLGLIFFSLLIVAFASMSTIGVRLCWHGGGGRRGDPTCSRAVAYQLFVRPRSACVGGAHAGRQFMAREFEVFLQERAAGSYRPVAFYAVKVRRVSFAHAHSRPCSPRFFNGRAFASP